MAAALGVFVGQWLNKPVQLSEKQEKLNNILSIIAEEYVDVVDTDSLLETMFPALVGSLDPHSSYIPAEDLKAFNEGLEGSFGGIGVTFNMMNDTVNVVEVILGGPSQRVGLLAGDRIVSVNGEPVSGQGFSAEKVRTMLKGEIGTFVEVGVKRAGADKILTFDIERDNIVVYSVDAAYIIDDGIGYINVSQFSRSTYEEFLQALQYLTWNGAESFIVDLRGNPGGYLDMAVLLANEFLPGGSPIVYTKMRDTEMDQSIFSDGNGMVTAAPVVVLIDEFSASSSEILSGALQDNDRALIIGRRSFGKGLIQRQDILPDSSALQLTIGRYYTPSGRSIQKDYSDLDKYQNELMERFSHGESFSIDSIHQDSTSLYFTKHGRPVYGGGGIMPDIFVPSDTSQITGYYRNVFNAGLLHKFAFDYVDANRRELAKAGNVEELLKLLPSDDVLLSRFVNYAKEEGIPARWYYINISRNLIVNQLQAFIARDVLGSGAAYEIMNRRDKTVQEAVKRLKNGEADYPIE